MFKKRRYSLRSHIEHLNKNSQKIKNQAKSKHFFAGEDVGIVPYNMQFGLFCTKVLDMTKMKIESRNMRAAECRPHIADYTVLQLTK